MVERWSNTPEELKQRALISMTEYANNEYSSIYSVCRKILPTMAPVEGELRSLLDQELKEAQDMIRTGTIRPRITPEESLGSYLERST